MNLLRTTLVIALAAAPSLNAFAAASEQRARGAAVFSGKGCQHCHTILGKGGERGPDLSGVGRRLKAGQIRKQILEGGHEMPSFKNALQKSETDDLVAYLRSCRDEKEK